MLIDRALSDPERGYGERTVTLDEDARLHLLNLCRWRCPQPVECAGTGGGNHPPENDGVHSHHPGCGPGIDPKAGGAVRQGWRRSLRYHLGLYQVRARFRPGCSSLLAGQNARCRRRSALYPAPPDHPGRRGYWPGRPEGLLVAASAAYAYEFIGLPEGIFPIVEATLTWPPHRNPIRPGHISKRWRWWKNKVYSRSRPT